MRIPKPTMDEAAARFWTVIFAGATALGLVCGGLYTIKQYFDARDKDRETFAFQVAVAQMEARKPFFLKHLELCTEATSAAATIITTNDSKENEKAMNEFRRLLLGPLQIVESGRVYAAMARFDDCIEKNRGLECKTDTGEKTISAAINIAEACRQEEASNWRLDLTTIEELEREEEERLNEAQRSR
jgi:hypothetical protein